MRLIKDSGKRKSYETLGLMNTALGTELRQNEAMVTSVRLETSFLTHTNCDNVQD